MRQYLALFTCITSLTGLLSIQQSATAATLYNGSGLPITQGWLFAGALNSSGNTVAPAETPLGAGLGVQLNTNPATPATEYSGYTNYTGASFFNPNFPTLSPLNRSIGYVLSFNVAVNSSNASSPPIRGGFSVIAISSDGLGIELDFRPNEIFAQPVDFNRTITPSESATFNNSSSTNYDLVVQGNNYQLLANGSPIGLQGQLRNYIFNPSASSPPLAFNPYTTNNFLFLGDNTGQESSVFTLGAVSVIPVPFEFSPTYGLLAIAGLLVGRQVRRASRARQQNRNTTGYKSQVTDDQLGNLSSSIKDVST